MADTDCGALVDVEKEMSQDIPFEPNTKCDSCGMLGSFDVIGDYLCENCMGLGFPDEEDERRCYYADPASLKELWGYVAEWWSGIFR